MESDEAAGRARQRDLVRRGYDRISLAYRSDDGAAALSSLRRARRLVPAARFVQADMAALQLSPASADAVVAFYSLIHVPVTDQQELFPRIRCWLRPGGYFLAIVGAWRWTGTAPYLGAEMYWDHADTATYLRWLQAARLTPIWHRYIPEGSSGHTLVLAGAS